MGAPKCCTKWQPVVHLGAPLVHAGASTDSQIWVHVGTRVRCTRKHCSQHTTTTKVVHAGAPGTSKLDVIPVKTMSTGHVRASDTDVTDKRTSPVRQRCRVFGNLEIFRFSKLLPHVKIFDTFRHVKSSPHGCKISESNGRAAKRCARKFSISGCILHAGARNQPHVWREKVWCT